MSDPDTLYIEPRSELDRAVTLILQCIASDHPRAAARAILRDRSLQDVQFMQYGSAEFTDHLRDRARGPEREEPDIGW